MREAKAKEVQNKLDKSFITEKNLTKLPSTTRGYSPEIARLLDSRDAAIFLNQMMFRWTSASRKGFYKYVEASPGAYNYRKGDSWCEELVMSRHEFRKCRDAISTKVHSKEQAEKLASTGTDLKSLVVYYTSKSYNNVTYWYFNEKLYKKLYAMAMLPDEDEDQSNLEAERQKAALGRKAKNGALYTENTKEYNNMENNDFDSMFEDANVVEVGRKVSEKKREKVKQKAAKPGRKLTQAQLDIVREKKYGKAMPLDFELKSSIIQEVIDLGYDESEVLTEIRLFTHHYKVEHQEKTCVDWDARFRDFWMPNSVKFKKQKKAYSKGKGKNAHEERLEGLQRIAESSVFERTGTSELSELTENLRQYYDEVYGDLDS